MSSSLAQYASVPFTSFHAAATLCADPWDILQSSSDRIPLRRLVRIALVKQAKRNSNRSDAPCEVEAYHILVLNQRRIVRLIGVKIFNGNLHATEQILSDELRDLRCVQAKFKRHKTWGIGKGKCLDELAGHMEPGEF
jgi:hypothetical protein